MKKFLAIGHCCHDRIGDRLELGGTVSFVSFLAAGLGLKVEVVTSLGDDFLFAHDFSKRGITLHRQISANTTQFFNSYVDVHRKQVLEKRAQNIDPLFLKSKVTDYNIVLFAPIANEVDFTLSRLFPSSLKVATIQGALRTWNENGEVSFTTMNWSNLKGVDVVVFSEEDINYDKAILSDIQKNVHHFVLTKAEKGCEVYFNGQVKTFPAFKADKAKDYTGAGDVFAISYILAFYSSRNISFSARFANAAASLSIENIGLKSLPTFSSIRARMSKA